MARSVATISIAVGALAILSAMGLGAVGAVGIGPTHGSPVLPPAVSVPLGLSTDAVPVPVGVHGVPLAGNSPVFLTLTLAGADPGGLNAFLSGIENPASPAYRHFLTASQFEADFGPTPSTASAVASAIRSAGGHDITITPGRLAVTAVLPASAVPSLLGVSLERIGGGSSDPLYTTSGSPVLAPALRGEVVGVGGLSNVANPGLSYDLSRLAKAEPRSANSPNEFLLGTPPTDQWFLGSDFTQAYGASLLFPGHSIDPNATYPQHVAIATLLASGYNDTNASDLPPWDPAVIDWYLNQTTAPGWPTSNVTGVPVTAGGATPPLPGPNQGLNDSSLDQVENSLDLEMAASLAPGAPVYNFYFSARLLAGNPAWSSLADDFALDLSDALNYNNYGAARLGVVSGSFGLPNLNDSLWDSALTEAAATGVTVVVASGDQGNAPNNDTGRPDRQWPTWPGSAAFDASGAVAVGGVTLSLNGQPAGSVSSSGQLNLTFDRNVTGIANMSTWWDTLAGRGNYEGSEGGVATGFYAEPGWQFYSTAGHSILNASLLEGLSGLGRAEPDVAFPANGTLTMYAHDAANGEYEGDVVEGTSVAAPVFAGLLADMIAVKSDDSVSTWHAFGFLDPELYRIGSYFDTHPSSSADPYFDVTRGSNYFFAAGPGWDPTTGWGGIDVPLFLAADANQTVATFAYSGPTWSFPASPSSSSLPWDELYLVLGGGVTVAVVLVLLMARPRRSTSGGSVPAGAQSPPSPPSFGASAPAVTPAGATFLCPYCGAVRPAEPVRCPKCGAF
jgi:subtilase family serine protease